MNYRSYLNSPEWKTKREQTFLKFGKRCIFCGTTNFIQVHHKRYFTKKGPILGKEQVGTDIIPLCGSCHILWHRFHGLKKMNKKHQQTQQALLSMGFSVLASIAECERRVTSKHFLSKLEYYKNRTKHLEASFE